MRKADVQAGQSILVFGTSGAIDTSAVQLARDHRQALAPGGGCISVDDGKPRLLREDLVLLGELAAKSEITPVIDRTSLMDDIVAAHAYVDAGHKRGNVVIVVPSGFTPVVRADNAD